MLYVGPATAEQCRVAAELVAARAESKRTLKSIAEELGITRGTLHRIVQAHGAMRSYAITLQRDGEARIIPLCTVLTCKGAMAAAVAAWRQYPGTLKNLELPGWRLCAGQASFRLPQVREAARQGGAS
jgi:predicted transcriptional regulator